jgi:hypothetical protein
MQVADGIHGPVALASERAHGTYWIGGWLGTWAGVDAVKKKILAPAGNRAPTVHSVACNYTYWTIQAP